MKKSCLLRHGESTWNRENRFTGWTDVDLSEKGVAEAEKAGRLLREEGFLFRACLYLLPETGREDARRRTRPAGSGWVPVSKSWRLNEKHYGSLQGLNKKETAEKYGDEQVHIWRAQLRRGSGAARRRGPAQPALRSPLRDVPEAELPRTESLLDTVRPHHALLEMRDFPPNCPFTTKSWW